MKVVRLVARRPRDPVVRPSVFPEFAPRLADHDGAADEPAFGRVLAGPRGGTATLDFTGNFATFSRRVTYEGYSTDGDSFVDGTESIESPLATTRATYEADLELRGLRSGSMQADVVIGGGGTARDRSRAPSTAGRWKACPRSTPAPSSPTRGCAPARDRSEPGAPA